jgi:hypothetical protein
MRSDGLVLIGQLVKLEEVTRETARGPWVLVRGELASTTRRYSVDFHGLTVAQAAEAIGSNGKAAKMGDQVAVPCYARAWTGKNGGAGVGLSFGDPPMAGVAGTPVNGAPAGVEHGV